MLIYKIAYDSHLHDYVWANTGIAIKYIRPSRFSFLTSVRIAARCKEESPDAIVCYRIKDVMGAISARKLDSEKNSTPPYPIFLYIDTLTPVPLSINKEIANGLSAVLFESDTVASNWAQVVNIDKIPRQEVIPLPSIGNFENEEKAILKNADDKSRKITLIFFGPIHRTENLKKFLENISSLPNSGAFLLRIAGTGKARDVMPLVRLAKANKLNVEWLGEEYSQDNEIENADAFIPQHDGTFTQTEKILLANGIPFATKQNLPELCDIITRRELVKEARKLSAKEFSHEVFRSRILGLFN